MNKLLFIIGLLMFSGVAHAQCMDECGPPPPEDTPVAASPTVPTPPPRPAVPTPPPRPDFSESEQPSEISGGRQVAPAEAKKRTVMVKTKAKKVSQAKTTNSSLNSCIAASEEVDSNCSQDDVDSVPDFKTSSSGQGSSDAAAACQKAYQVAKSGSDKMGTTIEQCRSAIVSCRVACSDVSVSDAQKSQLESARKTCNGGSSKLSSLESGKSSIDSKKDRAETCMSDSGSLANMMAAMGQTQQQPTPHFQTCAQNPAQPSCPTACANPATAAGNPACGLGGRAPLGSQPSDNLSAASADGAQSGSLAGAGSSGPPASGGGLDRNAGPGNGSRLADASGGALRADGSGASGATLKGGAPAAKRAPISSMLAKVLAGSIGKSPIVTPHRSGKDSGAYSDSGSWIPPKVSGYKSDVDVNQFRPPVGPRGVASEQGIVYSNEIYGPKVNLFVQINKKYGAEAPKLNP